MPSRIDDLPLPDVALQPGREEFGIAHRDRGGVSGFGLGGANGILMFYRRWVYFIKLWFAGFHWLYICHGGAKIKLIFAGFSLLYRRIYGHFIRDAALFIP